MREYFIVYNQETGAVLWRGECNMGEAEGQRNQLPEGMDLMRVPRKALENPDPAVIDLQAIKDTYAASIDTDADTVRGKFITNTPGQMATYLVKEQEARSVIADASAPTPFLDAEASAIGKSVTELANEVIAQAEQWRPIGARIEALRRAAKIAVEEAQNLKELRAATFIDWPGTSPASPADGEVSS